MKKISKKERKKRNKRKKDNCETLVSFAWFLSLVTKSVYALFH